MATMFPATLSPAIRDDLGSSAAVLVFASLQDRLSKEYRVFHGVRRFRPREAKAHDGQAEILALRWRLRSERSRSINDALRERTYSTGPRALPRSSLGKTFAYKLSLWSGLKAVLEDPRFGSHSRRGAETAAILYTLIESAKMAGLDPHAYVLEATRRAIADPGDVTLPHELS